MVLEVGQKIPTIVQRQHPEVDANATRQKSPGLAFLEPQDASSASTGSQTGQAAQPPLRSWKIDQALYELNNQPSCNPPCQNDPGVLEAHLYSAVEFEITLVLKANSPYGGANPRDADAERVGQAYINGCRNQSDKDKVAKCVDIYRRNLLDTKLSKLGRRCQNMPPMQIREQIKTDPEARLFFEDATRFFKSHPNDTDGLDPKTYDTRFILRVLGEELRAKNITFPEWNEQKNVNAGYLLSGMTGLDIKYQKVPANLITYQINKDPEVQTFLDDLVTYVKSPTGKSETDFIPNLFNLYGVSHSTPQLWKMVIDRLEKNHVPVPAEIKQRIR